MQKTGREKRYPPQFGHWHGAPTPHICRIGVSLEESERHAAALTELRKQQQQGATDAPVRRPERPFTGR